MGRAYALAGQFSRALDLLEPALSKAIALAKFLDGTRGEAEETAKHALAVARKHKYRATEAALLTLLGCISLDSNGGNLEQAKTWLQEAVELTNRLEMLPESAHALFYLGNAYQQSGRNEEARSRIARAEQQFRKMGMITPKVVSNA